LKKRFICSIFALSLALTACGTNANNVTGTVTELESSVESTDTTEESSTAEETEVEVESEIEPAEEEATIEEADAEEAAIEVTTSEETASRGTMQGGVYENAFFGIGCSFDDSWTIAGEEEILEMSGLVADSLSETSLSDALSKVDLVYDLYAMQDDGLTSLNIIMQDLGSIASIALTEKSYIELSSPQSVEALSQIGFEDVTSTISDITFAGQNHPCDAISGTTEGIALYEKQVCIIVDHYIAIVTAASYVEDTTDDLLAMFYAVQ